MDYIVFFFLAVCVTTGFITTAIAMGALLDRLWPGSGDFKIIFTTIMLLLLGLVSYSGLKFYLDTVDINVGYYIMGFAFFCSLGLIYVLQEELKKNPILLKKTVKDN